MTKINEMDNNDFALVFRWLDDNDAVHVRLIVLITDVPDSVDAAQVKQVVSVMSKSILEGTSFIFDYDHNAEVDWQKGYKLIQSGDWNTQLEAEVAELKERSLMTNIEEDGVRISAISDTGLHVYMFQDADGHFDRRRLIPYSDLLDDLQGEKRITLRLPLELHSLLSSAAYRDASSSLNSFCINTLAEAVGYEASKMEEFEASKRKPGRPKKVQDKE